MAEESWQKCWRNIGLWILSGDSVEFLVDFRVLFPLQNKRDADTKILPF